MLSFLVYLLTVSPSPLSPSLFPLSPSLPLSLPLSHSPSLPPSFPLPLSPSPPLPLSLPPSNSNNYSPNVVSVPTAQATELSLATSDLVLAYTQGTPSAPLTAGAVYRFYITATNALGT